MRRALIVVLVGGCGRIGYDTQRSVDAGVADVALDASPDAIAACPAGTTELSAGSLVCIELSERGNKTWIDAKADCLQNGRRLCADAEWFEGCVYAVGIVDMTDDGYEWVAEETGGIALKRGPSACTGMSSHEIMTDAYEYRCCADR